MPLPLLSEVCLPLSTGTSESGSSISVRKWGEDNIEVEKYISVTSFVLNSGPQILRRLENLEIHMIPPSL